MTIDGIDFEIQEPWLYTKENNKKWFSHKFRSSGLRYEIATCNKTGDVVWLNGPFPCGSCPDIKIFRLGLKNKLGPMEKVVADRGYRGDSRICTPNDAKDGEHRKAMGFLRARHETFNGRLKNWGCLYQTYRHDRNKHHMFTESAVVIAQVNISNGNSLFQVTAYKDCAILR